LAKTARGLFGQRVKSLREKLGLSQEEFAARTGYTRAYVSLIENGRNSISLDAIIAFADVLKVTASYLLRGL
jgi:transcriptional regulator with XRE-family HTH domain